MVRCRTGQSILSQYCPEQNSASAVKFERFKESCIFEPAACWEANRTGLVSIGGRNSATKWNISVMHMDTDKDKKAICSQTEEGPGRKYT
jgi:hypothetical protein